MIEESLHQLLMQATLGSLVPIAQFAASKLAIRQIPHRKRRLRERVVAVNTFVASLNDASGEDGSLTACLQDAVQERDLLVKELASLTGSKNSGSQRLLSGSAAQWWFLLYMPSRPIGWLLRWLFFTLLFVTVAGTARGVLHINYLPRAVLVPFLIATFFLAVLVRLTAFYLERAKPGTVCKLFVP